MGSAAAPVSGATAIDPQTGDPAVTPVPPPPPEAPLPIGSRPSAELVAAAGVLAKAPGRPEAARPQRLVVGAASDPTSVEAQLQQDPTRALGFYGEGLTQGTIHLRAKGTVSIKGIAPWAEGDWYVFKVNHRFQRGADTTPLSTYHTKFAATR
jgi:hypothetical protein